MRVRVGPIYLRKSGQGKKMKKKEGIRELIKVSMLNLEPKV